jgi:predicted transcriptional regulator
MRSKRLDKALERVATWPVEAQDRLAEIALDIAADLEAGAYEPTAEELAGIDRGLRAAAEGRFVTGEQVEAVLAKLKK